MIIEFYFKFNIEIIVLTTITEFLSGRALLNLSAREANLIPFNFIIGSTIITESI